MSGSKVDLNKLSFRKGVIGEDLDDCPDCVWDEDRILTYCAKCEDSVDLMIAFLTDGLAKKRGAG